MLKSCSKLAALALAVSVAAPGLAKAQDVFEYGFQSTYAGPHCLNLYLYQPWVKDLEEKTGGRLKIDYFMSGAIVKQEETIPAIMNGNPELGGISPYFNDTFMPYTQLLGMPHLANDSVHATRIYLRAYEEIPEIKAEFDKVGKFIALWGNDRSALFSTKGPIMSPNDLKGKRVLFWAGGQMDQIKAWGGIPVQVNPNDTYMGLQRGMGDVLFAPLPVGVAYKIMEVTKDITILPAYYSAIGAVMNHDAWDELPDDLKQTFDESIKDFSMLSGELLYVYTNKDLDTMRAEGCTIHTLTDAQYQQFKDADRQVTMDFWEKDLARLGVKDLKGYIAKMYEIAASTDTSLDNLSVQADMQPVHVFK